MFCYFEVILPRWNTTEKTKQFYPLRFIYKSNTQKENKKKFSSQKSEKLKSQHYFFKVSKLQNRD